MHEHLDDALMSQRICTPATIVPHFTPTMRFAPRHCFTRQHITCMICKPNNVQNQADVSPLVSRCFCVRHVAKTRVLATVRIVNKSKVDLGVGAHVLCDLRVHVVCVVEDGERCAFGCVEVVSTMVWCCVCWCVVFLLV